MAGRLLIEEKIQQASKLHTENKFEAALTLYNEAITSPEISQDDKVIVLQNRHSTLIELERFEEALSSDQETLEEIKKIPDTHFQKYCKEFIYTYSLIPIFRAMALSDDQKEFDSFKQKGQAIINQAQEIKLTDSKLYKEFVIRKKWFQDSVLLHDLQSESKAQRNLAMQQPIVTSESSNSTQMLHYLLHSLQGSFEKALKCLENMLNREKILVAAQFKMHRKHFFNIVMKNNFFGKKPKLNKEGLDELKNCIIQTLPSLTPSLRIQVMIHVLCGETLLGHLFHLATGARAPSLARKGRLRDIAKSLSAEAKLEVNPAIRVLLDKDTQLKKDLDTYFPELSKKLYPNVLRKTPNRLYQPAGTDVSKEAPHPYSLNNKNEGNSYIRNRDL